MPRAAATHETEDSRDLILRAALRAFAQNGFDGATTREIASRAGVNHGLIPYYFGSKLKLWQAAVDLAFSELGAGLDTIMQDRSITDDRERAGMLLRGYVRFVARNPEFVHLMHDEGKRKGARMRWLVDRHVKPMYAGVVALMKRAQSDRILPPDLPPVHLHYILAGSVGLFFHQAEECKRLTGIDPFDAEAVENHARAVEHMLLGPPSEEKPS